MANHAYRISALDLKRMVDAIDSAVPAKNATIWTDYCVLSEVPNGLMLAADDGFQAMSVSATADVPKSDMAVALPFDLLAMASRAATGDVQLTVEPTSVRLRAPGLSTRLPIITDAPTITLQHPNPETVAQIDAGILATLIGQCVRSVDVGAARPSLTTIHLVGQDGTLFAESADGSRLAVSDSTPFVGSLDFMLPQPARAHATIKRMSGMVGLGVTKMGLLAIDYGNVHWMTRVIDDGKFPSFANIIPQDSQTQVTVNRDLLAERLKMATLFGTEATKDKTQRVHLVADADRGLALLGSNLEGEIITGIGSATVAGPTNHLIVNPKFLTDALAALSAEAVRLEMDSQLKPLVVRNTGQAEPSTSVHVIMPVIIGHNAEMTVPDVSAAF